MKENGENVGRKKTEKKRECRDSLHTTVPANLLRNKLTSAFHIKAPQYNVTFTRAISGYYSA